MSSTIGINLRDQNLASAPRQESGQEYTMEYLQQLMEKEEMAQDFVNVSKFGGELVNMSRHVDSLCKHLDGTAFYASSKYSLVRLFRLTRIDYGASLKRSAMDLFQMMHFMDSPEFLMKKAKRELEFLTVYSKIGDNIERSIRKITSNLKDWLADTNRILDVESFVKIETRYVHYKEKLTRLVAEVEERKISGKKSGKKRISRIERVNFLLY